MVVASQKPDTTMELVLRSFLYATCLLATLCKAPALAGNQEDGVKSDSFVVAAYLPDYRFGRDFAERLNASSLLLTDLILFSVAPRPSLSPSLMLSMCCLSSDHYEMARQARAHKDRHEKLSTSASASASSSSSLKVWVTVGGGGRSDQFPHGNNARGAKLAEGLVDLARREGLDGVDLDCEHFASQQDYVSYLLWVNATSHRLRAHDVKVSLALHAGQIAFPDVYEAVDRIHLMTYDMRGTYHADPSAAQDAVATLVDSGCPSHKVILGIPAYGRHQGDPSNVRTFAETYNEARKSGGLDGAALDDLGSNYQGYRGDSPKKVREKVALARSLQLGGVFFWELGQDKHDAAAGSSGGVLLQAAATGKVYGTSESEATTPQGEL